MNISDKFLYKILSKRMKRIESIDFESTQKGANTFSIGYSNGFVQGFSYLKTWVIILSILLIMSLISNIVLFIF